MRSTRLLTLCAALLALPTMARAEDTPPPPATPAPAPAAHTEVQPKARKEEEENTSAGLIARLKAWGTPKEKMSDEIASLKQALTESQATVATLQAEKDALAAENTALRNDVRDFAAWMEAREGTTPSGSTPEGKKAAEAIGAGVAAVVRKIGVNVADVPSAGSNGGASAAEEIETLCGELATADPKRAGQIALRLKELRAKQRQN